MKKFLYKFLVVVLAFGMLTPSWLIKVWAPTMVQAAAPCLTMANIGVLANGTGSGGTFKIGDVVTAWFDDTGSLPSDYALTVSFDFSEFGRGVEVGAETAPGSHIWQAGTGIIDGSVDVTDADIIVTATNGDGPSTVTDNEDHLVDGISPIITGNGDISIVENHSTPSSVAGIGDQIAFSAGTLVDITGDSTTYTINISAATGNPADTALLAGNTSSPLLEGVLNGNSYFAVTATDNAGNTQSGSVITNALDFDTIRPTLVSSYTASVTRVVVNFSESIDATTVDSSDFSIDNPVRLVTGVTVDTPTKVILDTTSALPSGATPTITASSLDDLVGNTINTNSQITAVDGVKPQVGPDVIGLVYTQGQNDRDDILSVGFSENIPTAGTAIDYTVLYDSDGNLSTLADQRSITVSGVSNAENDSVVELGITDQSGNLDMGGVFSVTVSSAGNVLDAAGNSIDVFANSVISDFVSVFDDYAPVLTSAGLIPTGATVGVGAVVTVYVNTDDALFDQNLSTVTGSINSYGLSFVYDAVDTRYEASYTVGEGDSDLLNAEALSIQLTDRAGNLSNVISTSGSGLNIDANTPAAPSVIVPGLAIILNSGARNISGNAEADTAISIYSDPNNDGDKSDGTVVATGTATGGSYSISTPLTQDADNFFLVTSTDSAGNESPVAVVPMITEDSTSPVVSLNFPNGGEQFAAGSSTVITWTPATDSHLLANPIDLYYSTNNGSSYSLVEVGEVNDGSYDWTVPDVNSDQVIVKIIAFDAAGNSSEDTSDAVFTIDNSDPTSTISSDLQGQVYGPNTWDLSPVNGVISGTADDSPAGIASVDVTIINPFGDYWNGAGWTATTSSVTASGTTAWSYVLDKAQMGSKNGVYTLAARATDNVGHVESTSTGTFIWDNVNPTASITAPVSSTLWRAGNRTITWSASDINFGSQPIALEYQIDGGGWNSITSATENDGYYVWNVPVGTNANAAEVRLIATDQANNTTQVTSSLFTIDSTLPTVSIAAPATGSIAKGTITLSATADDPTPPTTPSGVNYVRFSYRISGGSWTNLLPTDNSAPYEYSWDTTSVADGDYELRAYVVDNAGNSRTLTTYTSIVIDNTDPTVVLSDNHPDNIVRDADTVDITATFTEADQIDETTPPTIAIGDAVVATAMTKTSNLVWTYQWNVPAGHNHDEAVTITATDRAGNPNVAATGKTTYAIDNTKPILSATPKADDYQDAKLVILTSDDVNPDVIYFTTDNTDPSKTNGTLYSTPISVVVDTTIKAIAYDLAGNDSGVQEFVYRIAPVISGETSSAVGETSVTITWTTNQASTSRVVYDTVSHSTKDIAPNYGYAFSTDTYPGLVTSHTVAITELIPGTTYYFRTVSHGSPEATGSEYSFTTQSAKIVKTVTATEPVAIQPATPQNIVQEPAETVTPVPTEQGEIKGTETEDSGDSEDINWTPWIILFILIILAGAATGGYFYWFGKDDEEEIVSSEVIKKSRKPAKTGSKAKKAPTNKKNRW
ncbi:MAG: Ig-like domain-containing protein [Patescibacteria group bacterium]